MPAEADAGPAWLEKRTEHFVLHCEPDSYAARLVDDVALRAEAAYQGGVECFSGDGPTPTITLYLAGWLEDAGRQGWLSLAGTLLATQRDVVWLMVSPEHPAIGLERVILEVLVRADGGSVPGQ